MYTYTVPGTLRNIVTHTLLSTQKLTNKMHMRTNASYMNATGTHFYIQISPTSCTLKHCDTEMCTVTLC